MLKIDLDHISERGVPYENFLSGIKDGGTLRHYTRNLGRFLDEIPPDIYRTVIGREPDDTVESRAECFVDLAEASPKAALNIIAEYIRFHRGRVDSGEISANTLPNYIKPIKVLLDTNDVTVHWKRVYKSYPREVNSQDRAYTREELQAMLAVSRDITDKVILTMFSSAGFRLESWDYFTWKDIVFFRDEDEFTGAALLVYRGDPESYWTFITPEACRYLWMYRDTWRAEIGRYPDPDDPLLRPVKEHTVARLFQKGVRKRVEKMAKDAGLRPPLKPGQKRYAVKLDHGFRKYFNTMMRRAKVNHLDKEDMMGHKVGLEKNYERYIEADFERFPEYQKAISFLTISDTERLRDEAKKAKAKTRRIQDENAAENARLRRDIKELQSITDKLNDSGILEIIKNINSCPSCSSAYVGDRCPKCT